ncbi:uncharacterized protein LOC108665173 [Hyalella azteca]|uniref:Uncharacterized protein LOC108665173 n=1 Tax=Hyalella azteca TaxID=294128 RepID=A0A8B7N1G2_HYAAZ|nr:uncharacterized protein LOC108665173 [Hyalella azteca]
MTTLIFWGCLLLFAAATLSERGAVGADDFRYVTGYAGPNYTGVHYQFTDYTPDLSVVQMDNTIQSACGVGIWMLYDTADYDLDHAWSVVCRYMAASWCASMGTACNTSSLRYAGSPYGLNDNYYNLYEDTIYRGKEFRGNTNASDVGDLDMDVSSLVVTGQSPWTFYTGLHYTGANVCVYPYRHSTNNDIHLDFAYYDKMDYLGMPDNSIRSVARGCLSDRVLGHPGHERRGLDDIN